MFMKDHIHQKTVETDRNPKSTLTVKKAPTAPKVLKKKVVIIPDPDDSYDADRENWTMEKDSNRQTYFVNVKGTKSQSAPLLRPAR